MLEIIELEMIPDQSTQEIAKKVTDTHSSHYLIIVIKYLIVISKSYLGIHNVIMDLNKMTYKFFSHVAYKYAVH